MWSWISDPFGTTAANDDPDGDGVPFTLNLRFPGQYFDTETGLHYNYFRYYDPDSGRYVTSDPIGLAGGLNTYGYVGGDPVGGVDLYGLRQTYPVVAMSASVGYRYLGIEVGSLYVLDPCTLQVYVFNYWGVGPGVNLLSITAAVTLEVGILSSQSITDVEGIGFAFTGVLARGPKGVAGQVATNGNLAIVDTHMLAITGGWAYGYGAGGMALVTYTELTGVYDIDRIQKKIGIALLKSSNGCENHEVCKNDDS